MTGWFIVIACGLAAAASTWGLLYMVDHASHRYLRWAAAVIAAVIIFRSTFNILLETANVIRIGIEQRSDRQ